MPWFPFTESLKKKVCRYLLQHYLGHFLQQKLQYDQLSVDLYNGAGSVQNVQLDVFAINEVVQKVNAPIEILDGSVRSISVIIPWKNIFSESCIIEIKGIYLTVQPKYIADTDLANMTDSFYNSFKNMTTSMEVAQECMRDVEKQETETPMGGLDMFAQAIESIFRRIKLKFGEINLRFEHFAPPANLGVGLQLSIRGFEYFDEDSDRANELAAKSQGNGAPVIENVAFSCKQFRISGVDLSTYQFLGNKGITDLQVNNGFLNESVMINPVLIAQIYGEQEVKIRIKQNDQISGPKIDGELFLGNIAALVTPKQLNLLVDFLDGFLNPSNNESNFTPDSFPNSFSPSEAASKPLSGKLKTANQRKDFDCFRYDSSEFTPVESPTGKPKIVQFHSVEKDDSFSSDAFKSTFDHFKQDEGLTAPNKLKRRFSSNGGGDLSYSEALRLQIKVVALSLTVLHADPTDIGKRDEGSSVDNDAHTHLLNLVRNYFRDVRTAFENHGLVELFQCRPLFVNAARKHDHLRLLAGPLHVECERKVSSQKAVISSTKVNASVGNAEFLECLYNGENHSSKKPYDCIELLVFPSFIENNPQSMHISTCSAQCIRLTLAISDTNDLLHTSICLQLSDCKSEVDISIIDRISDLIYSFDIKSKTSPSTNASGNFATITPTTALYDTDAVLFQKVLDESEMKSNKLQLELTSSCMHIAFRFPIPDLRPEIQKRPWFERMLRDEVLYLDIKDIDCETSIVISPIRCSENCKTIKCKFREMSASYAETPFSKSTLFLRTCQYGLNQSEAESDYDWPFVQIELHEQNNANQLLSSDDSRVHVDDSTMHFSPHSTWETEFDSHIPLFNSRYEPPDSRKPSPFSHTKVIHNDENLILPGDEEEIQEFVEHASSSSKVAIVLNFPVVNVALPSKEFIENIYNRFGNDLLLWEPAAPQPNAPTTSEMHLIPPRLDLESQFFSTKEYINDSAVIKSAMYASSMTDDDASVSYISNNNTMGQKSYERYQNQSILSLSLNISKGTVSLCSSIKSENGESQTGQIFIELSNGSLFVVSQYLGNPNIDFISIQVESCSLYHKVGLVSIPVMEEIGSELNVPTYLNSIIYPVNIGVVSAFETRNMTLSSSSQKMINVVLKLELEETRAMKRCLVAALLKGLTLRHQFLPAGQHFLEQLIEMFDLKDTPVLGYEPPTFVTEVHFHVNKCAVDYKPLHLSSRVVASIASFALSSNVTADAERSTLQIAMDNVNLFLSDNFSERYVDLRQNFVNVLSIAMLELCLKLRSQPPSSKRKIHFPDLELAVSNSHIRMWTCADSCALLAALLRYIAENGDIVYSNEDDEENEKTLSCNGESDAEDSILTLASTTKEPINQKASYEEHLEDLLADAVVEFDHTLTDGPSIAPNSGTYTSHSVMAQAYEEDARSLSDFAIDGDEDFCIIDDDNARSSRNEPQIEYLVEGPIVIVDNYFTPVTGRADQLKAPEHFPMPILRYAVREMSCSWYIFGGNDFPLKDSSSKANRNGESHETYVKLPNDFAKRSPLHLDKKAGGVNRNYKVLMEFHVTKARFHQEIYSPDSKYASRTVLAVANFEVHDRLQSSQINKFLYHFHNESSPKQSNADMLLVKALLVRVEQNKDPECKLRVSLQPLRLNIDQDALIFLTEFFGNLASSVNDDTNYPFDDASTYGTAQSTFAEPKLEVKVPPADSSHEVDGTRKEPDEPNIIRPLFFNEFIFSPAVPIRLDYHGKHIAIEHGKIAGLLMGLGRLNCSQLRLQKIVHRHGLLGLDKLINFTLNEWAADIRNNQLPSILGGVGPIHSFVQLFQGFRDLVWLPVEQYRKDGRIVRGLQRGTSSFGTSTSMAVLELGNRLVWFVQSAAETACDIVSPSELQRCRERYRNSWRGLEKQARRSRQPSDIREGFNNAYSLLHHGFADTAYSIARVAQQEHERKGLTGAVGGVIRHMPLTLVRPFAFTSEATSNLISGIRNQIEPDARKEDEDKWRDTADGH